ncbi:MAG: hypothetical protein ACLFRG_18025 [Desulfococcaceae bacterium]
MKRCIHWSPVVALLVLFSGMNVGAATYQGLAGTLVDLPGWNAQKAEGMHMKMGGTTMANANRSYRKDDAEVEASVTVGGSVMGPGVMGDMKMETETERVSVSNVDGYRVHASFSKDDNSGAIVVSLLQDEEGGAIFTLTYHGLSEENAMDLAQTFDWEKMKEEAEKLR